MFNYNARLVIRPSSKNFSVERPYGLPVTFALPAYCFAQKLLECRAKMLIDIDRRRAAKSDITVAQSCPLSLFQRGISLRAGFELNNNVAFCASRVGTRWQDSISALEIVS